MSVTVVDLAIPMLAAPAESADDGPARRLVALARAGDRGAFGALIEPHLAAARRLARAALAEAADADEAVQDASMAAWERLESLEDPMAFRAWYMRIVWRKALDRRRAVRSWWSRLTATTGGDDGAAFEPVSVGPRPDEQLMANQLRVAVTQVVKALPPRLRDPFLLAASGDHRYEEIAAVLGIPVGTVKWRVSEARRVMRLKLERLGHGVGQ